MGEFWVVWSAVVGLGVWVLFDFWCWSYFLKRHHMLNHEGRWDDLETLLRKQRRAFSPWSRLVLHFRSPAAVDRLTAALLFQRGRAEEALSLAEAAVRGSRGHAGVRCQSLGLQILALLELGRYDDARAAIEQLRPLSSSTADYCEAFACLYLGRLDHALALAQRALQDPKADQARSLISNILHWKGEPRPALEALLDRPADVTTYYTAEELHRLERTGMGRSLVEAHRKQWAGVVEPLRFLQAAHVYLDLDDIEGLRFSLEKAAAVMGGNPSLKVTHRGLEACLCAAAGDPVGAERRIEEGAEVFRTHARRTSAMEHHRFTGRANLLMGRAAAAVASFEKSLQAARHPMELHLCRFWLARAYEAAGDSAKAAEIDRAVAADGIVSKFSKASPPAPSEPPRAS